MKEIKRIARPHLFNILNSIWILDEDATETQKTVRSGITYHIGCIISGFGIVASTM